jgi:rod shape-determining protein MreD
MADRAALHPWAMRLVYLAIAAGLIFANLLPLETVPHGWAGPDILVAVTFAWVLRRPDYVPPALVAGVFLLTDLLFQRPPGLWAALVLLGAEALRSRAPALRDLTFPVEWLNVATTLVAMTLAYRIVLAVLMVDQAPLGLSLMQMVATLVAYPVVVLLSRWLLGVRKRAPGDVHTGGGPA